MTRAALDAYYTPDDVARRCVRWLSLRMEAPRTIVEPSVGGGAWVRAALDVWPGAIVDAYDVDPDAHGLTHPALRCSVVRSWLDTAVPQPNGPWDLVLGNPPYADVDAHIAHSLRAGRTVALLLRETVTGGEARWRDLWRLRPPAWLGKLPGRVSWQGASSHESPDTVGHVLVVWGEGRGETRWGWIPAEDDAERQVGLLGVSP